MISRQQVNSCTVHAALAIYVFLQQLTGKAWKATSCRSSTVRASSGTRCSTFGPTSTSNSTVPKPTTQDPRFIGRDPWPQGRRNTRAHGAVVALAMHLYEGKGKQQVEPV